MKHCSTCQLIFADHTQLCPHDGTALRLVEDIQAGMIVRGKYRILEWIGAGGMAAVYRARHEMLKEERAIKLVLPKYASDRDFLKRFRHEAAIARRLRHENAVWVEDLDETEDGRPFIAMEFLRGDDLRGLIRKEGPFPVERTLTLASQIASALGAAHELGIIHRDIKPDNVFITVGKRGQEVAKVLDFGIAKAKETQTGGAGYTPTKTGMIVGTPQYISPEQAMGNAGDKLDGRADLYSLGIVIYEMLTGRLPFESDTPMGMVLHHINTKPLPPHELMPALGIPPPLSAVLMKALEKDPARRFQTADELVQALRNPGVLATVASGLASTAATTPIATVAAWPVPAASAPKESLGEQPLPGDSPPTKPEPVPLPSKTEVRPAKGRLRVWLIAVPLALLAVVGVLLVSRRQNLDGRAADLQNRPSLQTRTPTSPAQGHGPAPATGAKVNSRDGLAYVWIPPGTFRMGCSVGDRACDGAEKPAHTVTLTKGFWMAQTEVTQGAYQRMIGANPSHFHGDGLPVERVTWRQARTYCEAVGMRLPTEAEWEYAARAGSTASRYADVDAIAWYEGDKTHEVGQKEPNAWKLYDMLGNVWEWTNDWYESSYYSQSPSQDPRGPSEGLYGYRVVRGGSFSLAAGSARVSGRYGTGLGSDWDGGFRCVGEVP